MNGCGATAVSPGSRPRGDWETVDGRKRVRVAEEAVQRTEQVQGAVRREEVTIDEDAVVDAVLIDEDRAPYRP